MNEFVRLPLIDQLTSLPKANWDYQRRPVILLDGEVHYAKDVRTKLSGSTAYIYGTNQQSFDKVCPFINVQKLTFYEMRVPDLTAITKIDGLTDLAIIWNTKATSIEVLNDLGPLRTLVLEDTPKITDLSPLATQISLEAFGFRGNLGSLSSKNTAQSLAPLSHLENLVELSLLNLKVNNGGLSPLARCKVLKALEVSNQFDTSDYAFLKASLPNTSCDLFAPYRNQKIINADGTTKFDIAITGRRKPYLLRKTDEKRIAKYEREFERIFQRALLDYSH